MIVRPLAAGDQRLPWDLLHVALWDPPPAPLRPREILDHPEVRIYAQDWGRAGDVGVLGLSFDGRPVSTSAADSAGWRINARTT